jgi:outer membrane protein assembly factor BamB
VFGLNRIDEFDLAFHPIIADGRLFYGSSATDTLSCLEAASGRLLWDFATEGPIRVPPVYADGRVYCGSDDGWLYCLDAATGRQWWRHRPGPSDRRLPGNSRMISRWPVRSGIVVRAGRVYCAAGVFPSEGVFLCALDCRDGQEIWKHAVQTTLHGPMIASESRLYAPALRSPVQSFDLSTGQPTGEAGGGGSLAAFVGGKLASGPTECGAIAGLDPQILTALGGAHSLQLAAAEDGRLVLASERLLLATDPQRRVAWKTDRKGIRALMLAGSLVFAGGDGLVVAYRLSDGREAWSSKIAGTVRGLAAAGRSLFAATEDGAIHCFATRSCPASGPCASVPPASPLLADAGPMDPVVKRILQNFACKKGYCLILAAGDYGLATALARRSDFQIIAVDDDRAAVKAAREGLARLNLYGPRIAFHLWPEHRGGPWPTELPYPDFIFNLIVIRAKPGANGMPRVAASEMFRMLRPEGGTVVVLADETVDRKGVEAWGAALPDWKALRWDSTRLGPPYGLPDWKVQSQEGMLIATARRGRLPGSGEWTHQYANAGNTACSGDTLKAGGGEIQWFGPPGPEAMVDRHNRTSAPLFHQGRLFVAGEGSLTGVDAYNGTVLWRNEVPQSTRLAVSMDCGNVAAGSGQVYMAAGRQCLAFDGATGDRRGTFEFPPLGDSRVGQWAYVATCDGLLFGTATVPRTHWNTLSPNSWSLGYADQSAVGCSYALFAFDTRRPSVLWTYEPAAGLIVNPTVAIDAGQAIFVEGLNENSRELGECRESLRTLVEKGARLVAIDVRTGRMAWSRAIDMSMIQTSPFLAVSGDTILLSGAKNVGTRLEYELHAFHRAGGRPIWTRSFPTGQKARRNHGEQNQHPVIVGDQVVFKTFSCRLSTGDQIGRRLPDRGCGTVSASQRCCFFRAAGPGEVDFSTGEFRLLSTVSRPGCWINIIPAGGLVLIPEASSGCTCAHYPLQTSLALRPCDDPSPIIGPVAAQRASAATPSHGSGRQEKP